MRRGRGGGVDRLALAGLTGFIGPLDVVEEPPEAGGRARVPLLPADRGAHVLGGSVGADFVVLTLLNGEHTEKYASIIETSFY